MREGNERKRNVAIRPIASSKTVISGLNLSARSSVNWIIEKAMVNFYEIFEATGKQINAFRYRQTDNVIKINTFLDLGGAR